MVKNQAWTMCDKCNKPWKYALYDLSQKPKVWLHVCIRCEGRIGDSNMLLQGYDPRTSLPLTQVLTSNK